MPVGTSAYVPLANVTLGSSVSTVTFSSISQSYRDLRFVILAGNTGDGGLKIRVNSDTGSNYYWVGMRGDGGGASSSTSTDTAVNIGNNIYSLNTLNLMYTVDFLDYSATDKHKTVLSRGNNPATAVEAHANRWANTSAITSIQVIVTGGGQNIYAGSTFALYGIAS